MDDKKLIKKMQKFTTDSSYTRRNLDKVYIKDGYAYAIDIATGIKAKVDLPDDDIPEYVNTDILFSRRKGPECNSWNNINKKFFTKLLEFTKEHMSKDYIYQVDILMGMGKMVYYYVTDNNEHFMSGYSDDRIKGYPVWIRLNIKLLKKVLLLFYVKDKFSFTACGNRVCIDSGKILVILMQMNKDYGEDIYPELHKYFDNFDILY